MSHWALEYIGKPWEPGALGPDAYFCFGLVQDVFRKRHGIELPFVHLSAAQMGEQLVAVNPETSLAIRKASEATGWRLSSPPAEEDDIVLMRNPGGHRHIGVIVAANGGLGVLHADGTMTPRGPQGCVAFTQLEELRRRGCTGFEFWRRA